MPISVPNYRRNTDRLQFGLLIDITSESAGFTGLPFQVSYSGRPECLKNASLSIN